MKIFVIFLALSTAVALKSNERIIGGQTININQAPYMATISIDGKYECTGIILSEVSILTSFACGNRCKDRKENDNVDCYVSVGSARIQTGDNWVSDNILNRGANMAIIRTQITLSDTVQKLLVSKQDIVNGAEATVSGYNTDVSLFFFSL